MFFAIMLVSCSDGNDNDYDNKLLLIGDTSEPFSKLGEEREFVVKYTITPAISDQEVEKIIKSSKITIIAEKENFTFTDYVITGNSVKFKIICMENRTGKIIEDKLRIHITNSRINQELTEGLMQESAEFNYKYKIESEIIGDYTIPAEGGTFNIPIQGKRLTFINDKFDSEVAYSLNGLHFVSNNVNTASVHNTFFIYGKSPGEYLIQLIAQPYNFIGDYLWEVEFRSGDEVLYHLNVFQPQTLGEDFSVFYSKTSSEKIFIDK